MRRLGYLSFLLLSLSPGLSFGSEGDLCTVTSVSPTAVNSSTVSTCAVGYGARLTVQCDAAAYIRAESTTTGLATSTSRYLKQYWIYEVKLRANQKYFSVLSASGTANCYWKVDLDQ